MTETKLKWGIQIDKINFPFMWSVGACISHMGDETYLYINLIRWSISIGRIHVWKEEE